MRFDIRPDVLNQVAGELAYEGVTAPGRPLNAKLRKAVSASYYALFHAIGRMVTEHVLPGGSRDDQLRLTRSLDHRTITDVCSWVSGAQKPPQHAESTVGVVAQSENLVDLATAFPQLQQARFGADYDHHWDVSEESALSWVQVSRAAVEKLAALDGSVELEAFLALVALKTPRVR